MNPPFRYASCNEMFGNRPFAEACRVLKRAGYSGIEIAPFTLAENPLDLSPSARAELRDQIASEGLAFAGLHWLMVSSAGLHVTTPDPAVRRRGWQRIAELIDLCADLGPDAVMVFGSPQQRRAVDGITPAEATRHFIDGLASVAPRADERGVTILVEALPLNQCDVVTSLAEAAAVVHAVSHPAVQTMFDTHNAVDETEPHASLIERYFPLIRHDHVNETDGRHPGAGAYPVAPLLAALSRLNYRRWVSVEAFDFTPGADRIAVESLRHLEKESPVL